ncbi:MAG: hypothetical protein ABL888_19265, partial [Pirellulaceae bacterium]
MRLQFGLYLIEQGIITCDQFCGLVGIQQQMIPSPSTVALQRDLMTIRQVARVYDELEKNRGISFLTAAVDLQYLTKQQAQMIEKLSELLGPSFEDMLVECRVMTREQTVRLRSQFESHQRAKAELRTDNEETWVPPQTVAAEPIPTPKFTLRQKSGNRSEEF